MALCKSFDIPSLLGGTGIHLPASGDWYSAVHLLVILFAISPDDPTITNVGQDILNSIRSLTSSSSILSFLWPT